MAMNLMRAGADMLNESIVMNDTYGIISPQNLAVDLNALKWPQADNDPTVYVDMRVWSKKQHAWVAWTAWCGLAIIMVIVNRHIMVTCGAGSSGSTPSVAPSSLYSTLVLATGPGIHLDMFSCLDILIHT